MELTMDQARLVGMELRKTVTTQAFEKVVATMREQYRTQLFSTQVDEQEKRERLFLEAQAFDDLLITINTFVAIANADAMEVEEPIIFE